MQNNVECLEKSLILVPLDLRPARFCTQFPSTMILPETFSHIENIKKRAGHLWRFL